MNRMERVSERKEWQREQTVRKREYVYYGKRQFYKEKTGFKEFDKGFEKKREIVLH